MDEPAPTFAEAPKLPDADEPPAQQQAAKTDEPGPAPSEEANKPAQTIAEAPKPPAQQQAAKTDEPGPATGEEADKPAPTVADASKPPETDEPPPAAEAGEPPAGAAVNPAAPVERQAAAGQEQREQAPADAVSVDSVDYDDRGNLALAGTAKPGSVVEPKIAGAGSDAESLGETKADEQGDWSLKVERPVAPGRYALTVEERSPEGTPRSRIRLPFERADPITDFPPGDIVVVQPGNSLWRIARRIYGQGVRYTVIYAANRAQIGDPDLIFPGQIFSVPQETPPDRAPG